MEEELKKVVEKMLAAGEPEENIAIVIRNYKPVKAKLSAQVGEGVRQEGGRGGALGRAYNAAIPNIAEGVSMFNRGATQAIPDVLNVIGAAEQTLGGVGYASQAAEAIQQGIEQLNPVSPEFQQSTTGQVLQGVGQIVPLVATGGTSASTQLGAQAVTRGAVAESAKALGKQLTSAQGVIAGSMVAAPEWEQAKAAGLSDEEAFKTLIKNYFVGQSEVIPIQTTLSKLNAVTGGKLLDFLKASGSGGVQEFLQEGVQTYLTNQIAKEDYDPDRDPMFQVLESAKIGGIVGLIIPSIGIAMQKAPAEVKTKMALKIAELQGVQDAKTAKIEAIDKAIAETSTGDPAIDVQQDIIAEQTLATTQPEVANVGQTETDKNIIDYNQELEFAKSGQPIETHPFFEEYKDTTNKEAEFVTGKTLYVGSGPVPFTPILLKRKGVDVTGLDISKEANDLGEKVSSSSNAPINTITEDAKDTDYSQFDTIIVALEAGSTVSDKEQILNRIQNTAKQGATVIVRSSNSENAPNEFVNSSDIFSKYFSKQSEVPIFGGLSSSIIGKVGSTEFVPSNESTVKGDIREAIRPSSDKITASEYSLLKDKIRNIARGVRMGNIDAKRAVRDVGKSISEIIEKQQLPAKQQNAVLKRATSVNFNNPIQVEKLFAYVEKVTENANNADRIASIESTLKNIKGKIKSFPASQRDQIKTLSKLPVESIDLDQVEAIADAVYKSSLPPTNKNYAPLNLTDLENFNDQAKVKLYDDRIKQIGEEYRGFTPEELDIMFSDEVEDPYQANADAAKKQQVRETLLELASYSRIGLDDVDITEISKALKSIDPESLTDKELKAYIKTVDNAIINNDFGGAGWVWAKAKAQEGIKQIGKTEDVKKLSKWSQGIKTSALLARSMFGVGKTAAKVSAGSGVGDVMAGSTKTTLAKNKLENDYVDLCKSLDKKNGGDVRSVESTIRQQISSYLTRYKDNPIATLQNKKNNIELSIERQAQTEPELAVVMAKVYDEFKNARTQEEVFDILKKDNSSYEVVKFFMDRFAAIKGDLKYNTEVFHNEKFVEEENYLPIKLKSVDPRTKLIQDELETSRQNKFKPNAPVKPKRAGTTFEATDTIPEGFVIDMEFASNMISKYRESLYDVNTTRYRMQAREFFKSNEAVEIYGGTDNLEQVITSYNNVEADNRGTGFYESNVWKSVSKALGIFRDLAMTTTFGSPTKFITQYVPGSINTMFNLKDPTLFFKVRPSDAKALLEQYPIGERGGRFGGTDFGERLYNNTKFKVIGNVSKLDKVHASLENVKAFVTKPFVAGDVNAARRAWLAYYTDYLTQAGEVVDIKQEADRQNEPLRKEAANYAEQRQEENMGPNLASRNSELFKKRNVLKDLILPLSNYSINMKDRMLSNYRMMLTGNETQRKEAALNQAGTFVEMGVYVGLTYGLLRSLKELGKDELRDLFGLEQPDDEEREKSAKMTKQMVATSLANEFNPFIIGDLMGNAQAGALNAAFYYISDESEYLTQKQWTDQVGSPFIVFEKDGAEANLGLYSIPLRSIEPVAEQTWKINDGTITINGNDYPLTPEQERFFRFNAFVQMFQTMGVGIGEVSQMLDAIRRQQKRVIKRVTPPEGFIELPELPPLPESPNYEIPSYEIPNY